MPNDHTSQQPVQNVGRVLDWTYLYLGATWQAAHLAQTLLPHWCWRTPKRPSAAGAAPPRPLELLTERGPEVYAAEQR